MATPKGQEVGGPPCVVRRAPKEGDAVLPCAVFAHCRALPGSLSAPFNAAAAHRFNVI